MIYNKILEQIKKVKSVAIFSHINSDADAIGSSIALKLALENMGKKVTIFIDEPIHSNFEFMNTQKHLNQHKNDHFELAICLDCPNPKRFGTNIKYFYRIKNTINIDHHPDNEKFALINLVDDKSCSTSSIIYKFLSHLSIEINQEMATCLYAGIAGDTGRFKHNNTTSEDMLIASKLLDLGADLETINYYLFARMSQNEFSLLKLALNKTEFYSDNRFALICLDINDFIKTDCQPNDAHFLIDYLLNLIGTKIAVVMSQEKSEEFKVSIRSRDDYSAQNVAKSFGGGGHIRASGCRIFSNISKAKKQIIDAVMQEDKRCTE